MSLIERLQRRLTHSASERELRRLMPLLRPQSSGHELIRIGPDGDGGYLVPDDLEGIAHCFSPGVYDSADFELHLAQDYGVDCYLADASVAKSPVDHARFTFDPLFLGKENAGQFVTLERWMADKLPADDRQDCLLQMDIEGAEFDVLEQTPLDVLRRMRIIVLEVHHLNILAQDGGLRRIRQIFEKVCAEFLPVHLHANNCAAPVSFRGHEIPPLFELTLLRKDRLLSDHMPAAVTLPHPLDAPNVPEQPDIVMPGEWWREGAV